MKHIHTTNSRRLGSFVIEAVVAAALLATAIVAVAKLAGNAAAVSQQADQRLAATLAAENVIERVRKLPFDSIQAESSSIAESIKAQSNCDVVIQAESFNAAQQQAIHLTVQVATHDRARVTLHDWYFKSSTTEQASSDESPSTSEGDDAQ